MISPGAGHRRRAAGVGARKLMAGRPFFERRFTKRDLFTVLDDADQE
jgi:hypothetical protein